jgi:hypothetical protein
MRWGDLRGRRIEADAATCECSRQRKNDSRGGCGTANAKVHCDDLLRRWPGLLGDVANCWSPSVARMICAGASGSHPLGHPTAGHQKESDINDGDADGGEEWRG